MKILIALFTTIVLYACSNGFAFAESYSYNTDYELAAASSTITAGPTGGAGDILDRVIIVPETTGAATVAIKDGSGSAINIFVAGTLSDLHPIIVPIGARSTSGGWQILTGANVHAIAVGRFK